MGVITLASIALIAAGSRGFLSRISIFAGLVIGYGYAYAMGDVKTDGISAAKWFALPSFTSPTFDGKAIVLFLPVVLVLIAGVGAIGLSLSPKFGAVLSSTPVGALGGI